MQDGLQSVMKQASFPFHAPGRMVAWMPLPVPCGQFQNLCRYGSNPCAYHVYCLGGALGYVDHKPWGKGTAVGDAHIHRLLVFKVGYPDHGSKGQGAMRSGKGKVMEAFPAGRLVAIAPFSIP